MGNSTAKDFARSDPTVFRSQDMFKGMERDIIKPLTKYTTDIATIPIKAMKKGITKRAMLNGNKTKKNKK